MKSILVAVAISLIASSSALAFYKGEASSQAKIRDSKAMVIEADDYDVYVGGRLIGRDPDPAIRSRLRNDHYLINGH